MKALRFVLVVLAVFTVLSPRPQMVSASGQIEKEVTAAVEQRQMDTLSVDGLFNLRVLDVTKSHPDYVSSITNVVTLLKSSLWYGGLGFTAHNWAAGSYFSKLNLGDVINLNYTDGSTDSYEVEEILRFQALQPNSGTSNFVELDADLNPIDGTVLSSTRVFLMGYDHKGHLILQTCINKDENLNWGRLFVIAKPVASPKDTDLDNETEMQILARVK